MSPIFSQPSKARKVFQKKAKEAPPSSDFLVYIHFLPILSYLI